MATRPSTVPSADRGFLLGDGLFETVRLWRGRPFRLDRHIARLERGAELVGIPIPGELRSKVAKEIAGARDMDAVLRITLTRGSGAGLAPPGRPRSRLVVAIRPLAPKPHQAQRGLRTVIRGRVDERSLVATLKTLGYLERIQALRLARGAGVDDALLRNSEGRVIEGSSSNLFALRGETLLAPGPGQGALPGITRSVILEVAERLGLQVEERAPRREDLVRAAEAMLSSTLRGIVPVVEVERRKIGGGVPGPLFRELAAGYEETVRRELGL
jgi:branched-subunit amino acid aminotransferase/4-amino-4-deoxychorismate lyase